jgi:NADPH:quinone reductase-like Zn-dependent oxidoreductase
MKAIIRTRYGSPDVLQFAEIPKSTPDDNEVLVQVCAASVNPLDLFLMQGWPRSRVTPGLRTPKEKVLGCDIAGRVKAIGRNVTRFRPGDEVFGVTGFGGKGFAEYVCAIEEKLAPKPTNISFEDAAAVPIAACTALQGIRDEGEIQPGRQVLV